MRLLAEGGQATVYLARQVGLNREVAVKFLHCDFASDPDMSFRFEREARALASLRHSCIVSCYSHGVWRQKTPYMVLELVNGQTLRDLLREQRRLPWEKACAIAMDVCGALQAAHNQGIVHRDIKPENIAITTDGVTKVLDFGLAHILGQKITRTGTLIGSVIYMSPEQATGAPVHPSSDLYSLGCVLHELIDGQPPFWSDNPFGLMHQHKTETAPLLDEKQILGVPAALQSLLQKAMAKDAEERYESADEMAKDLYAIRNGLSPKVQVPARKRKITSERTKILSTNAIFLLIFGCVCVVAIFAVATDEMFLSRAAITLGKTFQRRDFLALAADNLLLMGKARGSGCVYVEAAEASNLLPEKMRLFTKAIYAFQAAGHDQMVSDLVLPKFNTAMILYNQLPPSNQTAEMTVSVARALIAISTIELKRQNPSEGSVFRRYDEPIAAQLRKEGLLDDWARVVEVEYVYSPINVSLLVPVVVYLETPKRSDKLIDLLRRLKQVFSASGRYSSMHIAAKELRHLANDDIKTSGNVPVCRYLTRDVAEGNSADKQGTIAKFLTAAIEFNNFVALDAICDEVVDSGVKDLEPTKLESEELLDCYRKLAASDTNLAQKRDAYLSFARLISQHPQSKLNDSYLEFIKNRLHREGYPSAQSEILPEFFAQIEPAYPHGSPMISSSYRVLIADFLAKRQYQNALRIAHQALAYNKHCPLDHEYFMLAIECSFAERDSSNFAAQTEILEDEYALASKKLNSDRLLMYLLAELGANRLCRGDRSGIALLERAKKVAIQHPEAGMLPVIDRYLTDGRKHLTSGQ